MKPLIGITPGYRTGENEIFRYDLPVSYGSAVTRAGGLPVLVAGDADEWTDRLDGLLLPGGEDIAPERYGAVNQDSAGVCERRDEQEITLARAFWQTGKPIFGICRGIQLVNVALGGTLYQDIAREMSIDHPHSPNPCHNIIVLPGSLLSALLGNTRTINSTHHQAIRDTAPCLRPCAWSESGRIIEAVEATDGHPLLAVQWHPERMTCGSMDTLLGWFIAQCAKNRDSCR